MFTGIIETIGTVTQLQTDQENVHITIASPLAPDFHIDQSVAHNGVCLTVVVCDQHTHTVTAIRETIQRTNLSQWQVGTKINLERCLKADSRIDGHFVQGHVDQTAQCVAIEESGGSWYYTFQYTETSDNILVNKGSVCIDGTSLTVILPTQDTFSVAIIPYTHQNTVFHTYQIGTTVNLEFDIIGKYLTALFNRTYPQ